MERGIVSVKELRQRFGMTQQEFADYFGISSITMISDWERERFKIGDYLLDLMSYKLINELLKNNYIDTSNKKYTSVKELRTVLKWSQSDFAGYFDIPKRTIQDWEYKKYKIKPYLFDLMYYKLKAEKLID